MENNPRLLFDVTCLMPEKLSGVGVYAKHLYGALKKQGVALDPVLKWSRVFKKNHVREHMGDWPRVLSPLPFPRRPSSVFHGPDFRLIAGSSRFKRVVTVHDVIVFHEGFNAEPFRLHGQARMNEMMAQKPDAVVVPSRTVAEEVKERYPEAKDRVFVVHHGADHFAVREQARPKGDYFLYVGHLEKRKNISTIIKAFEKFAEKNKDVRLVLVGKPAFGYEQFHLQIASSPARSRIVTPGFVRQDELEDLYAGAIGFLFPSYYEGFGFPILEAMALNTPVITSNRGAMKEVAGDAAVLVDPFSAEDLAAQMERLTREEGLRQVLISKGRSHVKSFTWAKAALAYMEIYKSLF